MKWFELLRLDPHSVTMLLLKKRRNLLAKEFHDDGRSPDHNLMVRINKAYEEGEAYIKERDTPKRRTFIVDGEIYTWNKTVQRDYEKYSRRWEEIHRGRGAIYRRWEEIHRGRGAIYRRRAEIYRKEQELKNEKKAVKAKILYVVLGAAVGGFVLLAVFGNSI